MQQGLAPMQTKDDDPIWRLMNFIEVIFTKNAGSRAPMQYALALFAFSIHTVLATSIHSVGASSRWALFHLKDRPTGLNWKAKIPKHNFFLD